MTWPKPTPFRCTCWRGQQQSGTGLVPAQQIYRSSGPLLGYRRKVVFATPVVSNTRLPVEPVAFFFLLGGFGLRIPDIELTERETELLEQIRFRYASHDELRASLMPMAELTKSLLKRGTIPEVRLLYFTDPERNPGGRGKSRQRVFENNGTSGTEIYSHGSFLKFLEYFIYGPALPSGIVAKFKEAMSSSGYLTAGDINDLAPAARAAVRSARLKPHEAAEEFHKLALECGAMPSSAESIRKSILAVR